MISFTLSKINNISLISNTFITQSIFKYLQLLFFFFFTSDLFKLKVTPGWSDFEPFFLSFLVFLGPYPWHMEIPRLGVKSELQPLAHTSATAMPDLSQVHDPHHNSRQLWILNPLNEARDRTHSLMDTSWILNLLSHNGNIAFTWHRCDKECDWDNLPLHWSDF